MGRVGRLGILLGGAAVALVLCASCRDSAAQNTPAGTGSPVPVAGTTSGGSSEPDGSAGSSGSGGSAGDLATQLDGIQSTLDGVQSQVNSDSTP